MAYQVNTLRHYLGSAINTRPALFWGGLLGLSAFLFPAYKDLSDASSRSPRARSKDGENWRNSKWTATPEAPASEDYDQIMSFYKGKRTYVSESAPELAGATEEAHKVTAIENMRRNGHYADNKLRGEKQWRPIDL